MNRQRIVDQAEVTAHTGLDEHVVDSILNTLVEKGFVVQDTEKEGRSHFRVRPAFRGKSRLSPDIWQALASEREGSFSK
jgi:DNA-binding IclR family transcriptional regulator